MLEEEKQKGREIARMSAKGRSELIAKLMFGRGADTARLNFALLMTMWGIGPLGNGLLKNLYIGAFFTRKKYRDALKLTIK